MDDVSEMVSRVARAIAEQMDVNYDKNNEAFNEYARAAIRAMREPTDLMTDVTSENKWHAVQDYQAMIDAALGE